MKKIKLNKRYKALVDDEDYEKVITRNWFACKSRNTIYAISNIPGKSSTVGMHRFILGITDSKIKIDHEDHDGLNNQRHNLRVCTNQQNCGNQKKCKSKGNSSRYKGVSWKTTRNCWVAQICFKGNKKHLGYFTAERSAAIAYDRAARKCFGEFACCNFQLK